MPKDVSTAELFLNKKSKGPGEFPAPVIKKSQSIILVITCNSKIPYEVIVQSSKNVKMDWTNGDSCGGPNVNTYRTAAFSVASQGDVIKVVVPSDTEYFITAYRSN